MIRQPAEAAQHHILSAAAFAGLSPACFAAGRDVIGFDVEFSGTFGGNATFYNANSFGPPHPMQPA
jgi:hypothetical protein